MNITEDSAKISWVNTTDEDITNVFLVPSIQELYLNRVECKLDFDKIQSQENLKVLEMDGIK